MDGTRGLGKINSSRWSPRDLVATLEEGEMSSSTSFDGEERLVLPLNPDLTLRIYTMDVMNIVFSSVSLERSAVGSIALVLRGVELDYDFITKKQEEVRFQLDQDGALSFLESVASGEEVTIDRIAGNLGVKFRDGLPFNRTRLNLDYRGGVDGTRGLGQINSSRGSSKLFLVTLDERELSGGMMVSISKLVLSLGDGHRLRIYSIILLNDRLPRFVLSGSDDLTGITVPVHSGISDDLQMKASTFSPFLLSYENLHYIFWEKPQETPEGTILEINMEGYKTQFEILRFADPWINFGMIVIPGPSLSDATERINFSIPNGPNENSTEKCLDGHQLTSLPEGIQKIVQRMTVRSKGDTFLVGQSRDDDYLVKPFVPGGKSGSDQNTLNFEWKKTPRYNRTEIYIIGYSVKVC